MQQGGQVCSGPAEQSLNLSVNSKKYKWKITQPVWLRVHYVSLWINRVAGMIMICEPGAKGAMKDQIINSRSKQISHILINYSVFSGRWMHSLLILQAAQKGLTETQAALCCLIHHRDRLFARGHPVWIQGL